MSAVVRGIGVRSAAALVAANMIGAGVFTTSGFALADLGRREFVLAAWAVGGAIALCGALSYAGLAARIPGNGGEYRFLSRAVHPLAGFLAGWVSLVAGFTAPIAVAAHGLEAYARAAFELDLPSHVLGTVAILTCGLLHGRTREGGLRFQDAAVAAKLVAIGGLILGGAWVLGVSGAGAPVETPPVAGPAAFSLSAFGVTLVWISFAYSGWNAAVYLAGELEDPIRTLPRALLAATLGVGLLYTALNAVFLYAAPMGAIAGRAEVGAIAAEALGGAPARALLAAVVSLGLLTSISAMIMVGPRVYAQMADDGLLPLALVPKDAEPRGAIALQVILSLAAFYVGSLRELLDYAGFLLGLSAAATVACLFMREHRADARHRVPGYPLVPALFILMTLGSSAFLVMREPRESAIGVATVAVGGLVYAAQRRRFVQRRSAAPDVRA